MTRVSENQLVGVVVQGVQNNRERIAKFSQEVTSGLKVSNPGDSDLSGSISQFRESLSKVDAYKSRIGSANSVLSFQEEAFSQSEEVLIRMKEISEQAANETNGVETRRHMAEEVFALRDQLVTLANSKYQGKYIFGGTRDDSPPFINSDTTDYAVPATGGASQRWIADTAQSGRTSSKTVNITEDLTIQINTAGTDIFSNAIYAAERLGRALSGYSTGPAAALPPATPVAPDGTGAAYDFTIPTSFAQQTQDIKTSMDLLDHAREDDILEERIGIGGKIKRLEIAESILDLTKVNTEDLLDKLQNADTVESASNLTQAQNALQASFAVTARILNLSILDYI
jgi:flagellar hook-associated protein 3 FlgL